MYDVLHSCFEIIKLLESEDVTWFWSLEVTNLWRINWFSDLKVHSCYHGACGNIWAIHCFTCFNLLLSLCWFKFHHLLNFSLFNISMLADLWWTKLCQLRAVLMMCVKNTCYVCLENTSCNPYIFREIKHSGTRSQNLLCIW